MENDALNSDLGNEMSNENLLDQSFEENSIFIPDVVYDNLPESIKKLTSMFNGRERDVVLLSILGVLSNCLPKVYSKYDGHKVYSNLFILIIAPPASGKGVMKYGRSLIALIHDSIKILSENERKDCIKRKKKENKNEKDFTDCPQLVVKLVPANISSAQIYSFLNSSEDGLLIFETESDTLSKMFKLDWGNFSDILRKAYHHEHLSISRRADEIFYDIKEPKLSLVLSGTPNQLKQLIESKSNGLFSRFMVYNFDEVVPFHDVFCSEKEKIEKTFDDVGKSIKVMYDELKSVENEVRFMFTENQRKRFLSEFEKGYEIIIANYGVDMTSSFKRHGLMMLRVCMILTLTQKTLPINDDIIYCDNRIFIISLKIIKTVISHSGAVSNNMSNNNFNDVEEKFYYSLPEKFMRSKAVELGKSMRISERTIDDKLKKWCIEGIILKISHGKYKRIK